jgi:hypothetical protein
MDRHARLDRFLLDLHVLAMPRLRGQPQALATVQARLRRVRRRANAKAHDATWNRWQALLEAGDVDAIEASICADDASGRQLRANSPIHALFEQRELATLLDETAPDARRALLEDLSAPSSLGPLGKAER